MVVNELFKNVNCSFESCLNKANVENLNEMFIDEDEAWKQLKDYTSVIDASVSLQFKWNMSCLEENFLNSLNLSRVENSQVNK